MAEVECGGGLLVLVVIPIVFVKARLIVMPMAGPLELIINQRSQHA